MRDLIIDMADFGGVASAGDEVVLSAPAVRGSSVDPERIITPQPRALELVDGVVTVPVEVGPLRVTLKPRGGVLPGTTFETVVPEGEGPITLRDCLESQFRYDPPVVNRGLGLIEDARDEALGQVDAAVEDAILGTGGEVVRGMVGVREVDTDTETVWAHTTDGGYRLPLGYDSAGRLDAHARKVWAEDVNQVYEVLPDDNHAYLYTTQDGHIIAAVSFDGTVEIPRLKTGNTADPSTTIWSEMYRHTDGTLAPIRASEGHIAGWGSSSLQGMAAELASAVADLPVVYRNFARGGETIEHNAARMGAVPAIIEPVTIPDSGSVSVVVNNVPAKAAMLSFEGTLGGVLGTLSSTDSGFTFTRKGAGEPVDLPTPTPFVPTISPEVLSYTTIFQLGKNNMGSENVVEDVMDIARKMLAYLRPFTPRVIILGHHGNTSWSRPGQDYLHDRMHQLDNQMRRLVGEDHFIDVQEIMTGQEIWDRTGITPTPEDLQAQSEGRMAPSLGKDVIHFNAAVDQALADIVRERIDYLDWY